MLFQLPDSDTLYAALLARDPSYDGQAFVGVTSTGIFCRLSCPARKPLRQNCRFFETPAACIEDGFRPCKRCAPLGRTAGSDPTVAPLLAALEADPTRVWRESDLVAMGLDPSTVRRSFKRLFGATFLDMARQRRLREGFGTLAEGGSVIEAQLEAGFASPSAFRAAFARLLGCAPGALRDDALLRADWLETPVGPMLAVCDDTALYLLEFMDRKALPAELASLSKDARGSLGLGRTLVTEQLERELGAFFDGRQPAFSVPLATGGSTFSRSVWAALQQIPAGETRSYGDIARAIGNPAATRAVARANGANRIAIVVPCHRVIGADGTLTGYGGGLWRKDRLIALERQYSRPDQRVG